MPGVLRIGARPFRTTPPTCLLAACLLAACGDGAAPRGEADAQARTTPSTRTLNCLPGTLVSLQLPLGEGFAFAHQDPVTTEPVARCVLSLFGARTLKTPLAFDRAYGEVFAYHEEDGTLDLRGLAPAQLQLFRIGATAAADVWLLRTDIGTELEPAHRDVIFSTRSQDGALVDHLLAGAMGTYYRRDYDIEAAHSFAINEDTGRGEDAGPGYLARYRIADDGRFSLATGRVLPAPRERR